MASCQNPGAPAKATITPYVWANYQAGRDGSAPELIVYVNSSSSQGPAVKDATVTLNGTTLPWSPYGYYDLQPAPNLTAGALLTLSLSDPGIFAPVSVSLTVPSGAAPTALVSPSMPSGLTKRDTTTSSTYSVAPSAGSWPGDGVVVWAKAYDANYSAVSTQYLVKGSSAASCVFAVGKGLYTGLEVRGVALAPIAGCAAGSQFLIEGPSVAKFGFDPVVDLSPYHVSVTIEKGLGTAGMSVSADIYDASWAGVSTATVTVDGAAVPYASSGYYSRSEAAWTEGTSHTFSVSTPDGKSFQGTIAMPVGTLTGVSYSPATPTVATSYTVSPPGGLWPSGSRIKLQATKGTSTFSTADEPSGSNPVVFNNTFLVGATSVTFLSSLESRVVLEGYQPWSNMVVSGTPTSW